MRWQRRWVGPGIDAATDHPEDVLASVTVVTQRGIELRVVGQRVVACGVAPRVRASARADEAFQCELVAALEELAIVPGRR